MQNASPRPEPMNDSELAAFREKLAAASVSALWEIPAHQTAGVEEAKLWRWRDLEPLFDEAARATRMDQAERRVLSLRHPNTPPKGPARVTLNINAGMQILMPGERARPHRHVANALRFVIEGLGASTMVDGKACPMEPGDLILTPGWTWHEHTHEGDKRVIWLDVLDVPLMDYLKVNIFEPGPPRNLPPLIEDAALETTGFMPDYAFNTPHSPLFRYPWTKANPAIATMQPAEDGSRLLRYVNPTTGGPVMSLLDCSLLRIMRDRPTRKRCTTANAVCFAVCGSGVSTVGETVMEWQERDVFSLPHGNWISHCAMSDEASLFMVSDVEVLRRLGLLREEIAD